MAALTALALALGASPAFAARTHVFQAAVGAGSLSSPSQVAVDQSNGDLLVADPGSQSVRKFDSSGTAANFSALGSSSLGPLTLESYGQIGVDNSGGANDGNFYVATSNGAVQGFQASGEPADFTASAAYLSANAITGSPGSPFTFVCGATVDVNGAIYVGDYYGGVSVYAPSGEYLTGFTTPTSCNLAVDSAGNLYVASYFGEVKAFVPSAFPVTPATTYGSETTATTAPSYGIAVDPADDNLYVDGNGFIAQYDSAANANAPIGFSGSEQLANGSSGIAVDRSGGANEGNLFAATGAQVDRFGPLVTVPDATTAPATNVQPTGSATLEGSVDPAGIELSECEFQYGLDGGYGQSVPCAESPGEIGSGVGPVSVHADLSGLDAGVYHFRLHAANTDGVGNGEDQSFEMAGPPILSGTAAVPTELGAQLKGNVDPNRGGTGWTFEYGTTTSYGKQFPLSPAQIPAGTDPVAVTATIGGLSAGATYHYRLVATNASGTTQGPDQTFATTAPGASGGEGTDPTRAYELVTPTYKNGALPFSGIPIQLTADGNAVAYVANASLPGATTGIGYTAYTATRSASGIWRSVSRDAPQTTGPEGGIFLQATYAYSDDLSRSFQISRRALAPGAVDGQPNLYLTDDRTGERKLIATSASEPFWYSFTGPSNNGFIAATDDLSDVIFRTQAALTPDAVAGESNLYHFDGSQLHLVNLLPGGGTGGGIGPSLLSSVPHNSSVKPRLISPSGDKVFFTKVAFGGLEVPALYVRVNDTTTIPISVSQRSGEVGELKGGEFVASTDDGNVVFFTSSKLTDDSSANGVELYRYEISTGSLTDLSAAADPAAGGQVQLVLGVNEDGSHVYFVSNAKLAPGGTAGGTSIYLWHAGEVTFVAALEPAGSDSVGPSGGFQTSPSGRYLAFSSYSQPTGYENKSSGCTRPDSAGKCYEVYVYDSATAELSCATCQAGKQPTGDSLLPSSNFTSAGVMREDGTVTFESELALTPGDINGVTDVYTWRDGVTTRISSGRSPQPSKLYASTADGRNIFFSTSERLSALDGDSGDVDIYDARVGGVGYPPDAPGAGECTGETCQGPPGSGSAFAAPGSAGLYSPDNPKAGRKTQRRCGAGARPVKRRGKQRCVKRHHHNRSSTTRRHG